MWQAQQLLRVGAERPAAHPAAAAEGRALAAGVEHLRAGFAASTLGAARAPAAGAGTSASASASASASPGSSHASLLEAAAVARQQQQRQIDELRARLITPAAAVAARQSPPPSIDELRARLGACSAAAPSAAAASCSAAAPSATALFSGDQSAAAAFGNSLVATHRAPPQVPALPSSPGRSATAALAAANAASPLGATRRGDAAPLDMPL